jgi:hypothetical protein
MKSQQIKEAAEELATLGKIWFKQQSPKRQKTIALGAIAAIAWTPIMLMSNGHTSGSKFKVTTNNPNSFEQSCAIAKDLTEQQIQAMGGYDAVKQFYRKSTGKSCVLFK